MARDVVRRKAQQKVRHARIRRFLSDVKLGRGCADCGYNTHAEALDFDHVRGIKSFNIGAQCSGRSMEGLLKEIDKCEVVCANCHRVRTATRREAH